MLKLAATCRRVIHIHTDISEPSGFECNLKTELLLHHYITLRIEIRFSAILDKNSTCYTLKWPSFSIYITQAIW